MNIESILETSAAAGDYLKYASNLPKHGNPGLFKSIKTLFTLSVNAAIQRIDKGNKSHRSKMAYSLIPILIAGGGVIGVFYLGKDKLSKVSPKLRKKEDEVDKLRSALRNSHSPMQEKIFQEIEELAESNKLNIRRALGKMTKDGIANALPVPVLLKDIALDSSSGNKRETYVSRVTKILMTKYENSLTPGQWIIYKNIIKTEIHIAKSLKLYNNLILLLLIILGTAGVAKYYKTHKGASLIKAWEDSLEPIYNK